MSSNQFFPTTEIKSTQNMRDSLEIYRHLIKPSLKVKNEELQFSVDFSENCINQATSTLNEFENIKSLSPQTLQWPFSIAGDTEESESSIETPRDALNNCYLNGKYCSSFKSPSYPDNSLLANCKCATPINQCNPPLISPVEVSTLGVKSISTSCVDKPTFKAISPKNSTPKNVLCTNAVVSKPCKSKMRTSSPEETQVSSKAKKLLMLDLSSISYPNLSDSSLELCPRPTPPGTVNSDEIMGQDFTSFSGAGGAMENSFECEISPIVCMNKEACGVVSSSDFCDDVIERLPSPSKPSRPVFVTIKKRRLNARPDVLNAL